MAVSALLARLAKPISLLVELEPVAPRPLIFISAASRELRSARQLVANTLTYLGYEPVWQEVFGTEGGDLRAALRQQIGRRPYFFIVISTRRFFCRPSGSSAPFGFAFGATGFAAPHPCIRMARSGIP